MKIYIDADGCPVVNFAVKIAREFKLDIIIVKNYAHDIYDDYANIVSVDISNDSTDLYIVNNINKDDVIVTQDYGLAALCLAKNAYVLDQNGLIYTKENIDNLLNRRHIHSKVRRQGKHHSKFKKRKPELDDKFETNLRQLIASIKNR